MFKVGQLIVENGIVYKVKNIKVQKRNFKEEKIIYYAPFKPDATNTSVECSIPEDSIVPANIRTISTKEQVEVFFSELSETREEKLNYDSAIDLLAKNEITPVAKALKYFWIKIIKAKDAVTKTDTAGFLRSLHFVLEEVAIVSQENAEKTKQKIRLELSKVLTPLKGNQVLKKLI